MFWWNALPPSSDILIAFTQKMEVTHSFEKLVTTYRTTQHHNPEDTTEIYAWVWGCEGSNSKFL
jgi:hypothetical protein